MSAPLGKALVMGLGSFGGGAGATRYLVQQGWQVSVTDLRSEAALGETLEQLEDLPVRWILGEHREADFQEADLVLASPAVHPDNPLLKGARASGARIASEIELFLEALRARLVLVTGTQGKSSTCHLLETLLGGPGRGVFLGGNIGVSLLACLDEIRAEDFVVLELSSYQLEALAGLARPEGLCPAEAVCITNLLPDHLERHGSFEAYARAKRQILELLGAEGVALLPAGEPCAGWQPPRGRRLEFGVDGQDLYLQEQHFQLREGSALARLSSLQLPGDFQRLNALAALGVAWSLGVPPSALEARLPRARGLEHRLQYLGTVAGMRIHDNAVSTTPDSTIAALLALPKGMHLMMGGRSKGLPLDELAKVVRERTSGVTLFGEARSELAQALALEGLEAVQCAGLEEAIEAALEASSKAMDLLFSPACSSFDAFPNFKARARAFRAVLPLEPVRVSRA